jgi:hypothetical protein
MGQLNARRVEFDNDGNPCNGEPPTLFESGDVYNALLESYKIMSRYTHECTGHVYLPSEYAFQHTDMTFNEATRTLSHSPKAPYTTFEFFIDNRIFEKTTTQTYQIPDVEGNWYFYYDQDGVLQASQTPWKFGDDVVFTSEIYWDATNKKAVLFGEERHGLVMDWASHRRWHLVQNTEKEDLGLEIVNNIIDGDGSMNVHAQYGVNDGSIHDEDIIIPIRNDAAPNEPFEQILFPYVYAPVLYLLGTSNWRKKDATIYPFYENIGTRPYYNRVLSNVWSLQTVQDGWFFATWQLYTNDLRHPVMVLLGQREDPNLIDAVNLNTKKSLLTFTFPTPEVVYYRKLIWETKNTFTNTPKCRLRYIAEATEINPANDRYQIPMAYGGNANTGRYLETYSGLASFPDAPYVVPEESFIRTITLTTTALNTGVLGVFKVTNLTTPIASISLTNQDFMRMDYAVPMAPDDEIVVRVTSGSMSKPAIRMYIQTNL